MKANKTKTPTKRLNSRKPEAKPESVRPMQTLQRGGVMPPAPEDIAMAAYYNYLNSGRPQGKAMEHWLKAEAQLSRSYAGQEA